MAITANENGTADQIEFIAYHHPALPLGNYTLRVEQTVKSQQEGVVIEQGELSVQRQFSVLGPRFSLDPQLIHAMFPPAGSLGEHSNVLPHIVLNRSTLPWERTAVHGQKEYPWLALLLFAEGEKLGGTITQEAFLNHYQQVNSSDPHGKTLWNELLGSGWLKAVRSADPTEALILSSDRKKLIGIIENNNLIDRIESILDPFRTPRSLSLQQLMAGEQDCVQFPKLLDRNAAEDDQLGLEYGDHPGDLVTIIDVPKSLLQQITPAREELKWLSHVRRSRDAAGKPGGEEFAVIIGSRLPQAGELSTVHLVSIEGRFDQNGFIYQDEADDTLIRLISLKSWRFSCISEKQSFKGLLMHLNRAPDSASSGTLRLPKPNGKNKAANETAERYMAMGSVPLIHATRQGNQTVSWYHGPLVPGPNKTLHIDLPIRAADQLIRYNEELGMFDVSYSAAWELGRLLTLQNKRVAVDLFHWKRRHAQQRLLATAEEELINLPFDGPSPALHLPQNVIAWFEHLALLQGVPFNYLVPDERLLPRESIRFFQLDRLWIECLLDGVFSIGRILRSDVEREEEHGETLRKTPLRGPLSGFLLRSDVVAGWPGLQVDGYDALDEEDTSEPLFTTTQAKLEQSLNNKQIPELQQLLAGSIILSANCSIDNRSWVVANHDGSAAYILCQAANNEIDVRRDKEFLFSIDASFESELNKGKFGAALERLFQQNKEALPANRLVFTSSWFISDHEQQLHYQVLLENGTIDIYRHSALPLLRMERLSKNVLICLFEGIVQAVDIHLRPETIHFGLNRPDDNHGNAYYKNLRSSTGQEDIDLWVPVPFKNQANESNVIAIDALVNNINKLPQNTVKKKKLAWGDTEGKQNPPTSAHFALQMIEGVEKVRFSH